MTAKHALGPLGSFAQAAYGHGIAPINSAGHRSGEFIAVVHFADKSRGQSTDGQKAYARLFAAAPELLEACKAALAYDQAIRACANDPNRMSSFCTAEGNDLDALYFAWMSMSHAAIAKVRGDEA